MRAPGFLITVLIAASLAGCVQDPDTGLDDTVDRLVELVPIPPFPIEIDHDHSAVSEHVGSANLFDVGYSSGYGEGTVASLPSGQGFSELFVRDGLAFLGRRGGADGGFIILDVTDPAHPERLGDYQGLANYDMESTYDNEYVFFVSQYLNNQQPPSLPPRDAGDVPRGIHVVDVSNPADPTEAFFFPAPTRGAHTITYYRTEGGRELVAAQLYDFIPDPSLGLPAPDQGINPAAQRVVLFDFVRTPTPRLVPLSTFEKHPLDPSEAREAFPHDVAIQKHPLTGQLILYVAYWDLGAVLVDITDPTTPEELSVLDDFSPSRIASVHLAAPSDALIDGVHVTVTEPEHGPADETGQYTLFDTTDPSSPKRLGFWRLPGDLQNDEGLRFSPHNFEVEGGRLYLGHYHGGVWVVDISTKALQLEPNALAYVQPTAPRPDYEGDIPNVWTALYDTGYVYASDVATGLHVYEYAGERFGVAGQPAAG